MCATLFNVRASICLRLYYAGGGSRPPAYSWRSTRVRAGEAVACKTNVFFFLCTIFASRAFASHTIPLLPSFRDAFFFKIKVSVYLIFPTFFSTLRFGCCTERAHDMYCPSAAGDPCYSVLPLPTRADWSAHGQNSTAFVADSLSIRNLRRSEPFGSRNP